MKGIALRLWAYIISLILIILLILWLLQTGLLNIFYISRETNNIKREVKRFAVIKNLQDLYGLQDDIEAISLSYNAGVDIIDRDGRIVASSGRVMRGRVMNIESLNLSYVLKGEEKVINTRNTMMGIDIVSIGMPIWYGNDIAGAIFVHTPSSSIKDALSALENQFFMLIVIAVLIATLGAFFLSRRFTGPILKINDAALKISRGEFDTRVNIRYKDEIGKLGDTINHMASELSRVENLRRDLIANISHEFRTPLGIIRSYGEGLLDNMYKDEDERKEYINIILDETSRLSHLVDDVLELSKIQSGNISINIEKFSLSFLAHRVYNKFKVLCEEKRVNLVLDTPNEIYVWGDEARIEQVMINLLNNALNHTGANGTITISIEDGNEAKVSVVDTGVGIPEEDIPYIFHRFYKVDKSGNKKGSGTGLGLAIVKEVLKGHNSNFGVESKAGFGTRFYFSLKK